MQLAQALNIGRGEVVAFTGAGGKTSALFRVGRELAAAGWRVIGTTTTRIAAAELAEAPAIVTTDVAGKSVRPEALSRALNQHGFVFLYHTLSASGGMEKAIGIHPDLISTLIDGVDSDAILIEADGARRMPLKAPYPHEPVIPAAATLVVPVVGVDSVGQPLDSDHVYNPQALIDHFGYTYGERVKWPWVASILRDAELGLKGVPESARVVALINKVTPDSVPMLIARRIAGLALREPRLDSVVIGAANSENPALEVRRRVAAIVLAGGLSRRMNQPESSKVLLPWDGGRPIIRVITDRLKRMRLDDVVVVTGHVAAKVRAALTEEPVRFAYNPDYREGDMLSSLQTGLRALGPEIGAALIVLGDQPQLDARIVMQIITAYSEGKGKIVAPSYMRRRGHPILIDRQFWPELLALPPGAAPRDVINAHADQTAYIVVDTDTVLRDIDTPEDYKEARRRAGLP